MPRPIRAVVHARSIAANLALARARAPGAFVWAVVKANAYGHGIERVVAALSAPGDQPDGYALIDLADAARVRAVGWRGPILLLEGVFEPRDLDDVAALDLDVAVHRAGQIDWIERHVGAAKFKVHLKVDTGMNRLGFAPHDVPAALARLRAVSSIDRVAVMTHFADADLAHGAEAALACFDGVAAAGLPQSVANSAAILSQPGTARDEIRAGILLYGATPFADRSAAELGLVPAMTLESELIAIRSIDAGDRVGYGGRFVATRPTRIGVVACGYADGYPRLAPDGTPIVVDGVVCPMAGRVSMDMITVDVSEVPGARVGSRVELWGRELAIDDVARGAQTIGYELMCALAPRVPVVLDGLPDGAP